MHRGADHILVGRDLVDETQAIGFFGAEALAGRHHLHGAAEPDVADKAFVAFPSGDDAEADLRHADLRMGGGNAKVGRKQDFRAPADGETVDRRDDRDVQRLEAAEHRAREAHDLTELVLGLQRRIAFDVAAGAKNRSPAPVTMTARRLWSPSISSRTSRKAWETSPLSELPASGRSMVRRARCRGALA